MYHINIDKSTTVAFTGHRNINFFDIERVKEELTTILAEQYNQGYRTFITGMAPGFDLLSAEAVLHLQETCSDVQLLCAVPYAGQHLYYSAEDKQRYMNIADRATSNIILSSRYYDGCFLHRNDYMLNNCSLLIAYHNGAFRNGTGYTVRRATSNNIPIINLYK